MRFKVASVLAGGCCLVVLWGCGSNAEHKPADVEAGAGGSGGVPATSDAGLAGMPQLDSSANDGGQAGAPPADASEESGGQNDGSQNEAGAGSDGSDDADTCTALEEAHANEGNTHVLECSLVTYGTKPPSSGDHYPRWAAFGIYEFPLPLGYAVHNLEHGAVLFAYNCPDGCDAELSQAEAWFSNLAVDEDCAGLGAKPRAIFTPDPTLDVRWAASSWGYTLRASCFDAALFTAFYEAHVGNGLENVCSSGVELRNPDGTAAPGVMDCGL